MKNTRKQISFLATETIRGDTFDTNIHTPLLPALPARQIGGNRSGKDDFKFLVGEVRYALWRQILELRIPKHPLRFITELFGPARQ